MSQIQTVYTPNNGYMKTIQFTELNGDIIVIQATMNSGQKGIFVERTIYASDGKSTENVLMAELIKGNVVAKALKTENAVDAFIWSLIP